MAAAHIPAEFEDIDFYNLTSQDKSPAAEAAPHTLAADSDWNMTAVVHTAEKFEMAVVGIHMGKRFAEAELHKAVALGHSTEV